MGLLLLYEATVIVAVSFLSIIAAVKGIEVYKRTKREKRYSEDARAVINDAPLYYEKLLCSNQIVKKQDNIDLAILLAILNNSDLSNVIEVFGIEIDSLKKASFFHKIDGEISPDSPVKESIKRRVEELIANEFSHRSSFNADMLFLALDFQSETVHNVIWNAMRIEDAKEHDKKNIEEAMPMDRMVEEPVFYDHHYPEDNTIVKFTKKPTN